MPTSQQRGNPAIRWGDNLENLLGFAWPVTNAITSRPGLPGYETVQSPNGAEDAWVPGRGEFQMSGELGWIDLNDRTYPGGAVQTGWSGPTGVQAFLAWARDKRRFRFIPDKTQPDFWVDRVYLVDPIMDEPPRERDGSRRLPLTMRSDHLDFDWALRGLGLDLGPGTELNEIPRGQFDRLGSSAFYHSQAGNAVLAGADVLRDRHYIGSTRVWFGETAITNYCLQSQTFQTTWTLPGAGATVSVDALAAPDLTTTADKLVETAISASHYIQQSITIGADEWIAASIYLKVGPRFRGRFLVRDSTVANEISMTVRLDTGVITDTHATGTGAVLSRGVLVPLGDGWFRLELEGKVGGGFTAMNFIWAMHDDAGAESYLGDVAKGMYLWGAQLERSTSAIKIACGSYVVTTTGALTKSPDKLQYDFPWPVQSSWFYVKLIERGAALSGAFNDLMRWGEPAGTIPVVRILTGTGTAGANPFWRFNWSHDGGSTQSAGIANVTPAINDTVELFGLLKANGNVELHQAINGAAAGVFTGTGGAVLAGKFIARRLQLFGSANTGLVRFKAGFAPRVVNLAQARVA